ncbi:MAG: phosphate regulon sensor histidine kinase PhoR, partial [Pseudomonadota bacterium]|nr:phosphate regulon sensor histidine kinase PhoR [Pseudomonadota bacterium]
QKRNRKHKRKLSALLKRFKRSTAAMPDAAVVLGPDYEIEWFNHSAQQLLGLQPQDKGQPIRNLIRYPAFGHYLVQTEEQEHIDFVSPINPELMLRVNIVPYTGQRSLLLARDITNFHRLEQIRRDFVANLSHELNTPLTVIGGFVEIMSDAEDSCDAQCQRSLALIGQQVTRMRSIIDDMLLLSRLESAPPTDEGEIIKVTQILKSIYEEAHVLSGERNHNITLDVDEHLTLIGRSEELRSAFSNLVSNAIRYTPDGGQIHLRGYQDEQHVYVEVRDSGEGIAPEHIPHLTRRFYRVDTGRSRSQGGTGLGLAIVKYVLLRHHGELDIESIVGVGSSFRCTFSLPVDNDEMWDIDA